MANFLSEAGLKQFYDLLAAKTFKLGTTDVTAFGGTATELGGLSKIGATEFVGKLTGNADSATNATKLNNQDGSYYLNYTNFTNKPTIPATNVIPVQTTANKVLLSTTTSGTAAWSAWTSAGFLKTNTNGVVSIDTNTYLTTSGKAADSSKLNGQAASYYLDYNNLSNTPNLATVATSGKYSDLTGVPTKTSDFTNDSHMSVSAAGSVTASDRRYIKSVTLDGYGHVTGLTTGTETVVNTDQSVAQNVTNSSNTDFRPVILGLSNNDSTNTFSNITGSVYAAHLIYAKPSTGALYAKDIYEDGARLSGKYLAQSGGTVSGNLTVSGVTYLAGATRIDELTAGSLIVNGQAEFNNGLIGTLTGTASNASKLNGQESSYYLNYNNLTNKPTSIDKASKDGDGNVIKTSYGASLATGHNTDGDTEVGNESIYIALKDKAGTSTPLSSINIPIATNSTSGLFTAEEKKKLASITVSSGGVIAANNVQAGTGIYAPYIRETGITTVHNTGVITVTDGVEAGGNGTISITVGKADGTGTTTSYPKVYGLGTNAFSSESYSLTSHTHQYLVGTVAGDTTPGKQTDGQIGFYYKVNASATNNMPANSNANAILNISRHNGNYSSQLGFSSNGNLYYRNGVGSTSWKKIIDSGNIGSQSVNYATSAGSAATATSATSATNATYATKIGSSTSHPAIGSATQPVYIDSNGVVTACTTYANASVNYASSAGQLSTSRNISLGTGVTSTATAFNGTADIMIPVTGIKEAYLTWGGKDYAGEYGPLDAALIDCLSPNRLAFIRKYKNNDTNLPRLIAEYSRDDGATWTDYGTSVNDISNVFNGLGSSYVVGKNNSTYDSSTKKYADATHCRLRFRLFADGSDLYNYFSKFLVYVSTNGTGGNQGRILGRLQSNVESGTETYAILKDWTPISGWSGWNVWNGVSFIWYGNASSKSSQYGEIIFEFKVTSHTDANRQYYGLSVSQIRGYGGVGWSTPSSMARFGHMYSYDSSQNVTFPAQVSATQFNGVATRASGANLTNTTTNAIVRFGSSAANFVQSVVTISDAGNIAGANDITLAGALKKGSYTFTLPSASGTLALTSQMPTVNNGTLSMGVSGTGLSGSATFTANQSGNSTFTVTLDSSAAGNRAANKVVLAKAAGQIDSEVYAMTVSGTQKARMTFNNALKCIDFIFD